MSHHLRVLREAGLIHIDIEDGRQFVTLRRKELDEHLPGLLGTILGLADTEGG
jgi:DNA-binding transcriptional ArsR family regulator